MRLLFYILINGLIVGLFYYSKLTPHKTKLEGNYLQIFNFLDKIFNPLLSLLRTFAKPAQVGRGIAVDMSQIVLLLLLLILLKTVL